MALSVEYIAGLGQGLGTWTITLNSVAGPSWSLATLADGRTYFSATGLPTPTCGSHTYPPSYAPLVSQFAFHEGETYDLLLLDPLFGIADNGVCSGSNHAWTISVFNINAQVNPLASLVATPFGSIIIANFSFTFIGPTAPTLGFTFVNNIPSGQHSPYTPGPTNPKLTQAALTVAALNNGKTRLTQADLTVLINGGVPRITQVALVVLGNLPAGAPRLTQEALVVLLGSASPPTPISLACAGVVSLNIGASYSSAFVVTGGMGPYTFVIIQGFLPPGLVLNSTTGTVTGVPTTAGAYYFTIQVRDSNGLVAQSQCFIGILNPAFPGQGPIVNPPTDVYYELSKVIASMKPETHIPVRGSST